MHPVFYAIARHLAVHQHHTYHLFMNFASYLVHFNVSYLVLSFFFRNFANRNQPTFEVMQIQKLNERTRIAHDLRRLRILSGLTQSQVADAIGLPRSSVARVESGEFSTGFDLLQSIADALDADIKVVPRS